MSVKFRKTGHSILTSASSALTLVALVSCGKARNEPPSPVRATDGLWTFHALNGKTGRGPTLHLGEAIFQLEGCGNLVGTLGTGTAPSVMKAVDIARCNDEERALHDRVTAIIEASPTLALANDSGCEFGRAVEIKTSSDVVVFCGMNSPEE
ncbi:hypothetical protein [Caulobacter sp. HMWF025]|uniref:hypothetical protein n=1 Tax=Caulobacter sp. HMWF025 TaxID=2056860 RepID=UPI0011B2729D|nr:hypothetical protein [Caulobacter sp. HMWF025]